MAEPLAVGEPARHRRFELLDVLRLTAALMVVCFHWLFNGVNWGDKVTSIGFTPVAGIAVYGYLGVYLFFTISGYVITQSVHRKTAGQFIVSRGVRLYPAFWAAVILTTLVVTLWGNEAMQVKPFQFLANLTMVPSLFRQPFVDGVYWTLAFEVMFYALILVLLLLGFGRHLERIFPAWGLLLVIAGLVGPAITWFPYLGGDFAFFVAGAIIATIQRDGFTIYRAGGLVAAIAAAFVYLAWRLPEYNAGWRIDAEPIVVFAVMTVCFGLLMLTWIPRLATMRIAGSRAISDLTYPIYLLHAHIGYVVLDQLATDENVWLIYPVMFAGLFVTAWILHWGVEIKLRPAWERLFGHLRRPFDALQRQTARLEAKAPNE